MPPRYGKTSISNEEMRARSKFSFASCTSNGNVTAIELEEYQIRRKGHKRKKKNTGQTVGKYTTSECTQTLPPDTFDSFVRDLE